MKYLIYFSKRMAFALVYAMTLNMAVMAIMVIDESLMWLKYLLYGLAFVIYALVVTALAYRDGREAVKAMHVNDVERLNIIRTGENRPLNLAKEYKPWKGFMCGLFSCAPLLILIVILGVCYLIYPANPPLWAGVAINLIYSVIFCFIRPNSTVISGATQGLVYFYSLVAVPVYVLMFGIPYLVGAKKQMDAYKLIEEKTKQIHGD